MSLWSLNYCPGQSQQLQRDMLCACAAKNTLQKFFLVVQMLLKATHKKLPRAGLEVGRLKQHVIA